jgi:hypothetical protein
MMMMAHGTGGIQRGDLQEQKQRMIYIPCDHSAGPGFTAVRLVRACYQTSIMIDYRLVVL